MQGLPTRLVIGQPPQVTGFSCPDCYGVLEARLEGSHEFIIAFRCRTGHAFTARELLQGKEERIETLLWATLTALEELRALLRDLAPRNDSVTAAAYEKRIHAVQQHVTEIMTAIEENEPVILERSDAELERP